LVFFGLYCPSKSFHRLGYAFMLIEDGGTGNEKVGSGLYGLMHGGFVNTPIYFDIALEIAVGDHLTNACDFGEGLRDKILAPKTGVDGHDEDHIEEWEYIFEHENRR